MIRKNRVQHNKFTVPYFNKLNGEICGGNRGTRSNFTVPYSEKNSFITAFSHFFRFSSGSSRRSAARCRYSSSKSGPQRLIVSANAYLVFHLRLILYCGDLCLAHGKKRCSAAVLHIRSSCYFLPVESRRMGHLQQIYCTLL